MTISIIIPTYNEARAIGPFLDRLEQLPGQWEILIADGGSTDGTVERIHNRQQLLLCPKGRARQMNYAAARARGEVLWFVHCDSRLPVDAWEQISRAVSSGARWGCFHIAFEPGGLLMRCNAFFSDRRAAGGIAFGDQGIFIQRDVFLSLGGFPDLPIMEDYEFSLRLRRAGIPITQLPAQIVTSSRRYQAGCPLWTMWQMFYLRCLYRHGTDIQEIARRYRDIR